MRRSQQIDTSDAVKASPLPVQLAFLAIADLNPDPRNPRRHSRAQIRAIARSIETFGFNAPILINKNNQIIAGHGRYEAAKLIGLTQVPVICCKFRQGRPTGADRGKV